MFRRLETNAEKVRFTFDDRVIEARRGDTVVAALLAAGETSLRATPVSGASRSPYCMMGVCFECMVEIDGLGNRQACLTPVAADMEVRRQRGARKVL